MMITTYIKGKRATFRIVAVLGGRSVVANAKGTFVKSFPQLEEAHHVAERLAVQAPGLVFNFFLVSPPRARRPRYGIGVKES